MEIILRASGKASMAPNYVNCNIGINVQDKDKDVCGKVLVDAIGNVSERLKGRFNQVIFDGYSLEERKIYNKEKNRYDFSHFEGSAELRISYDLDMSTVEFVNMTCRLLEKQFVDKAKKVTIKGSHQYTLTEQDWARLKSNAVNNALDEVQIQAENIANHLHLDKVELKTVNFDNTAAGYYDEAPMVFKSRSGVPEPEIKEYNLSDLDKIIEFKDIEHTVQLTSTWILH